MGLWIAILITLAVMGSILWIKPSARERLLIEYRRLALTKGLKVRLLEAKLSDQLFPWIDNYRQFVLYEKSLPSSAKPKTHKAVVVRLSVDPNAHEIDGVDPIRESLSNIPSFTRLPDTAEAIVISASGIALLWRECSVDDIDLHPIELIDQFLGECILKSRIWT